MFAVIKSGGKQHKVTVGQKIKLETLKAEAGNSITFDDVLMVVEGDKVKVGAPFLSGVKVSGTVVSHGRAKKIHIIKFRRRKHSLKQQGHRQNFTEVQIDKIEG
jgi:large subunit ribosomal protein L21